MDDSPSSSLLTPEAPSSYVATEVSAVSSSVLPPFANTLRRCCLLNCPNVRGCERTSVGTRGEYERWLSADAVSIEGASIAAGFGAEEDRILRCVGEGGSRHDEEGTNRRTRRVVSFVVRAGTAATLEQILTNQKQN